MYHREQRQACDRCHGQKLGCKRENSNVSCTRCLRAKVICVSRPSLRSKRARHRPVSGTRPDFGALGPSHVGREVTKSVHGVSTTSNDDRRRSTAQERGQSLGTTCPICKCSTDHCGALDMYCIAKRILSQRFLFGLTLWCHFCRPR